MQVNSLAVFCGSKSGNNPLFSAETRKLGAFMAKRNITLVYGGGKVGLMGDIADAVMEGNGQVIGIIPEVLLSWEQQHKGITDLRVVADMHVRKKLMYELCDAAVVLPGGNGTLDELFEMLTWNTLKIHSKKIILLNCANYYDHLVAHIKMMQAQDFLYEDWEDRLIVCTTAEEAINVLS
jgi:uncharacterized protein (TIGR00730 family)